MKNKSLKRRYFLISFLITFTVVTIFGFVSFFSAAKKEVLKGQEGVKKDFVASPTQDMTFLCIGEGDSEKQYALMRFCAKDMALYIISLPSEMSLGEKTLSQTQSYLGAQFLCQGLSENLGVEISHYIRIDRRGFVSILDEMGSVYLTTENDIHYYSPDGYGFSLSKGEHILPAEKVYNVMRFDNADGEKYRLNRQSKVLCDVINQKLKSEKIPDAVEFFNMTVNIVDTNISVFDFDVRIEAVKEFLKNGKAVAVEVDFDENFSLTDECRQKITLLF